MANPEPVPGAAMQDVSFSFGGVAGEDTVLCGNAERERFYYGTRAA